MNPYQLYLKLVHLCIRIENQAFLRYCCRHVDTDIYGNQIYQAPYFDRDVNKIITVLCQDKNYLVQYFEWFDDHNPFYEELLAKNEFISI